MGHGDLGAGHLALAALAAQLAHASVSRNMPYMPGWVNERPPPLVFMASGPPPGPSVPVGGEGPALALLAEPRSSRCSSAVMVKLS